MFAWTVRIAGATPFAIVGNHLEVVLELVDRCIDVDRRYSGTYFIQGVENRFQRRQALSELRKLTCGYV